MRKITTFIVIFMIVLNIMNNRLSFASNQLKSTDKVSEEQLILDINEQTKEVKKKIKLVKKENEDIRKINKDYEKKYRKFRKLANKRDSNVNMDNAQAVDGLHKEIFSLQKEYKEISKELFKKRKSAIDESSKKLKELRANNKVISDDELKKIIDEYKLDGYSLQLIAGIKVRIDEELNRIDNKKASSINTIIPDLDFNKQDNYAQLMDDIIDKVILLRKAFTPYL